MSKLMLIALCCLSVSVSAKPEVDMITVPLMAYALSLNRLCPDEGLASCECAYGIRMSITGPVTASKLAECRPSTCICEDGSIATAPVNQGGNQAGGPPPGQGPPLGSPPFGTPQPGSPPFGSLQPGSPPFGSAPPGPPPLGPPTGPFSGGPPGTSPFPGPPPQIRQLMQNFVNTLNSQCNNEAPNTCACKAPDGSIIVTEGPFKATQFIECRPETCSCSDGTIFSPKLPDLHAVVGAPPPGPTPPQGFGGPPPQLLNAFRGFLTTLNKACTVGDVEGPPASCTCHAPSSAVAQVQVQGQFKMEDLFICKPETCICPDGSQFAPDTPNVGEIADQVNQQGMEQVGNPTPELIAAVAHQAPPPPEALFHMAIGQKLYERVSTMCDGASADSCECTDKELMDVMEGPFDGGISRLMDTGKLLLCKPHFCSCKNEDESVFVDHEDGAAEVINIDGDGDDPVDEGGNASEEEEDYYYDEYAYYLPPDVILGGFQENRNIGFNNSQDDSPESQESGEEGGEDGGEDDDSYEGQGDDDSGGDGSEDDGIGDDGAGDDGSGDDGSGDYGIGDGDQEDGDDDDDSAYDGITAF